MSPAESSPFARVLQAHSPALPGGEAALGAALAQLTGRTGKLLRLRLVLATARAYGWDNQAAEQLACAVEYFHVASLVLDDLPCMDDADERRGQPCVHRRHGDATAILAALALINRAYFLVQSSFASRQALVRQAAATYLDHFLGSAGLVGGQARDLAFIPGVTPVRDIGRIALAKSASLFGLSLMLPALAHPPAPGEVRRLRALCLYWGLAFQLSDDLRDLLCSSVAEGKTTGRDRMLGRPNLAFALGVATARRRLSRLSGLAQTVLSRLTADNPGRWTHLVVFQVEATAAFTIDLALSAA